MDQIFEFRGKQLPATYRRYFPEIIGIRFHAPDLETAKAKLAELRKHTTEAALRKAVLNRRVEEAIAKLRRTKPGPSR